MDRWKRKWLAPSSSTNGDYMVAQDYDGNFACGCRQWTMHTYCPKCDRPLSKGWCSAHGFVTGVRKSCKHIKQVQMLELGMPSDAKTLEEAMLNRMEGKKIHVVRG
jgi:hypothetical protein